MTQLVTAIALRAYHSAAIRRHSSCFYVPSCCMVRSSQHPGLPRRRRRAARRFTCGWSSGQGPGAGGACAAGGGGGGKTLRPPPPPSVLTALNYKKNQSIVAMRFSRTSKLNGKIDFCTRGRRRLLRAELRNDNFLQHNLKTSLEFGFQA